MPYEAVIVGGGLAGSSLAAALAREGAKVLILEREPVFRDRVRGEGMMPWGVQEARALSLFDVLLEGCAQQVRWLTTPEENRDVPATTPSGLGFLDFYHPAMQQCLLDHAVSLGAELRRGAEVVGVTPGERPEVRYRSDGVDRRAEARLVVGADGRNSRVRHWAGLEQHGDPECIVVAGTLYRGMPIPEDAIQLILNPLIQRLSIVFPVGGGRFRAYVAFRRDAHPMLSGTKHLAEFMRSSIETGASPAWFDGAESEGPLASFAAPDTWVPHPYCEHVVLIGDAAASSDPVFGCGLSLALRGVRRLVEQLQASTDWNAAGHTYAAGHAQDAIALHDTLALWHSLFFEVGPEADARRARALPALGEDPTRMPDIIALGPETPHDAKARARFFAEE